MFINNKCPGLNLFEHVFITEDVFPQTLFGSQIFLLDHNDLSLLPVPQKELNTAILSVSSQIIIVCEGVIY